ncbi:MAG TPA: hypothetical protein VF540_08255 [Segetibacter sp.]|jgi:hypothetical protein
MKVCILTILIILSSSTLFGQSSNTFPRKRLYWTNLQRPNYLDSLKQLGFLRYKNKGVVYNKAFYRTINDPDSVYTFKTTLDFYEYRIHWRRKGKKRFIKSETKSDYYYLGFAAAIFDGVVLLQPVLPLTVCL